MRCHPILRVAFVVLALVPVGSAQRREFLSPLEIEQMREAQEPEQRLKLYNMFAHARMDAIDKEFADTSAKATNGRGERVHDLLYEYQRIIDAIGDLVDEAQAKRSLIRKGLDPVVRAEPEFLKRLQTIEEKNPPDKEAYRFALTEAIDSTTTNIEELKKALAKQPTDKKMEKEIEKERKQEEKDQQEQQKKGKKSGS